ncbi:NAD-dependent epimerase [Danxiaibacter flavus]|uniref:NAD-dependent epimerase n=1 Tax=Danxiaibacter flavus TaxID=3049108 RepID=A0ABV3ZEX8_9BACT|nr:NAD-dependent epimerase [Chitinophagaceae bacterium DXS]
MKILLTGAAGFIGFHVANRLLKDGHTVVGIDSLNHYYDLHLKVDRLQELGIDRNNIAYKTRIDSDIYPGFIFGQLNLEDKDGLNKAFEKAQFDLVIHLAAQAGVRYSLTHPDAYISSNIVGFVNVLECCRNYGVRHLVFASSSSVYGLNDEAPFTTDQNTDHPISLYAATKKSNELMAHSYSHLFQIPVTGLRFFTVYGPWGRPDMAPFLFTKAIIDGKPLKVFNYGEMKRDFTYVDDIVEGVARIMNFPPNPDPEWKSSNSDISSSTAPYKIYNIGKNAPISLMDFIAALENEIGKKAIVEFLPMQAGDLTATYADVADLIQRIDYKPTTSIEDGVRKFVKWYRTYYKITKPSYY